ncbi:MAG: sodium:solute symporter family protein [Microscillaceae bacterium]
MLLSFIIVYCLLNLGIGYWASRRVKSSTDFALAGRNLPMLVAASAMFATWFGSETVMGSSSEFVANGVLGIIQDPFGAALCLLLVGLFFARPLYQLNILTFNDYYRQRFGPRAEWVSAIFMIPSYFGWIAAQLLAIAFVLRVLTGMPIIWGTGLGAAIVVAYTYMGGMWAVSITDAVQTIFIILGLGWLAGQLYWEVGSLEALRKPLSADFFRFTPPANFEAIMAYIVAWITIGLGSIPQQDVFQRVMSARSAKTAVRASLVSAFMYLSIAFLPLFIALCGKVLYPELLQNNADPQQLLPNMVLLHGSFLLKVLFFGALLSAIMSTTSGALLAPATVFAENLVRPRWPGLRDVQLLRLMRGSLVGMALISVVMANMQGNIHELVGQSSALSLVSLFVPLLAGLYWPRANETGALMAMGLGMAGWLFFEYWPIAVPATLMGLGLSFVGMGVGSATHSFFTSHTGNLTKK